MKRLIKWIRLLMGAPLDAPFEIEVISVRLVTPNHIMYEFIVDDVEYFFFDIGDYSELYESKGVDEIAHYFDEDDIVNFIMSKINKWIRKNGA